MARSQDSLIAEEHTKWLLEDLHLEYLPEKRLEEWLNVRRKRPDYLVKYCDKLLLIEVTSIEKERMRFSPSCDDGSTFQGWSGEQTYNIIRSVVRKESKQLADYKDLNIPSIIVLEVVSPSKVRFDLCEEELDLLFGIRTFNTATRRTSRKGAIFNARHKRYLSGFALQSPVPEDTGPDRKEQSQRIRWTILTNPFSTNPVPEAFLQRFRKAGFTIREQESGSG